MFIALNSNELHYYPLMASLARCNRSFNILDDLSSRICVLNKKEDVNLNVFNMITKINESKALKKTHFMQNILHSLIITLFTAYS